MTIRIPSGSSDRKVTFTALDATDGETRETGLTTFTVYRSRDGGTPAAMASPTIAELDAANTPGVYSLLVDDDTTIAAGHDTEEMLLYVTHAGMKPVEIRIELYRPKATEGNTATVNSSGEVSIGSNVVVRQVPNGFDPDSNKFDLIEGDDYITENGRETEFRFTALDGSTTGWTVEVGFEDGDGNQTAGTAALTVDGSDWVITIEWSAANLATPGNYLWAVRLTDGSSNKRTIAQGDLVITQSPLEANA